MREIRLCHWTQPVLLEAWFLTGSQSKCCGTIQTMGSKFVPHYHTPVTTWNIILMLHGIISNWVHRSKVGRGLMPFVKTSWNSFHSIWWLLQIAELVSHGESASCLQSYQKLLIVVQRLQILLWWCWWQGWIAWSAMLHSMSRERWGCSTRIRSNFHSSLDLTFQLLAGDLNIKAYLPIPETPFTAGWPKYKIYCVPCQLWKVHLHI